MATSSYESERKKFVLMVLLMSHIKRIGAVMAKECSKSVTNVQSCRFKAFLSPIPLWLVGVPNTLMKTEKVSVGLPIGVKQPKISRSVAVKFNLSHSSERSLILVFLWNKATNFRGIVRDCRLAAPTDFIRGISAGKLDSSRIRNQYL